MTTLSGKTALVTGASRGIGRATALALSKAGAQVLVHYSSSSKEADAVVAEIRRAGGRAEKLAADLRDPTAHTHWPSWSTVSLVLVSTSWLPTLEFRRRQALRTPPSKSSIRSSPSMSAPLTSWFSNCCP